MATKPKASGLPDSTCTFIIKIPPGTVAAIRARVKSGTSMSGIIRGVMESAFGVGKSPKRLNTLTPKKGETWTRIPVYCSTVTRDRGLAEVKRRGLNQNGVRRPLGIAPAVAWLLVQRFGGAK